MGRWLLLVVLVLPGCRKSDAKPDPVPGCKDGCPVDGTGDDLIDLLERMEGAKK